MNAQAVAQWRAQRRAQMLALRMQVPHEAARAADDRIGRLLAAGFPSLGGTILGFYWPIRGEVDPRVAVHRFRQAGARTVLPVVMGRAMPLQFQEWRGFRIGYGGGYFDRTLAAASPRPVAIALAREASRIETIHPQPHDIAMDFLVTEDGVFEVAAHGLRRLEDPAEGDLLAARLLESRRRDGVAS